MKRRSEKLQRWKKRNETSEKGKRYNISEEEHQINRIGLHFERVVANKCAFQSKQYINITKYRPAKNSFVQIYLKIQINQEHKTAKSHLRRPLPKKLSKTPDTE